MHTGTLKAACSMTVKRNVSNTVKLFTDLGLTLNMANSFLTPSQCITFLGFCIKFCSNDSISNPFKSHEGKTKGS